jgi:hypothetical protein
MLENEFLVVVAVGGDGGSITINLIRTYQSKRRLCKGDNFPGITHERISNSD